MRKLIRLTSERPNPNGGDDIWEIDAIAIIRGTASSCMSVFDKYYAELVNTFPEVPRECVEVKKYAVGGWGLEFTSPTPITEVPEGWFEIKTLPNTV